MPDVQERINKLKENSQFGNVLAQAASQNNKKPSLRPEIDRAFEAFQRHLRDARQSAANKERAAAVRMDILNGQLVANEKQRFELEKKVKEAEEFHQCLTNDIENLSAVNNENELKATRKAFHECDLKLANTLHEYATKNIIRTQLLKICLESDVILVEPLQSRVYQVFLAERSDIDPIEVNKSDTVKEVICNLKEAIKILKRKEETYDKQTLHNRSENDENVPQFSVMRKPSSLFDNQLANEQTFTFRHSESKTGRSALEDVMLMSSGDDSHMSIDA